MTDLQRTPPEKRLPNVERLCQEINKCKHPRRVLNALLALAGDPVTQHGTTPQTVPETATANTSAQVDAPILGPNVAPLAAEIATAIRLHNKSNSVNLSYLAQAVCVAVSSCEQSIDECEAVTLPVQAASPAPESRISAARTFLADRLRRPGMYATFEDVHERISSLTDWLIDNDPDYYDWRYELNAQLVEYDTENERKNRRSAHKPTHTRPRRKR